MTKRRLSAGSLAASKKYKFTHVGLEHVYASTPIDYVDGTGEAVPMPTRTGFTLRWACKNVGYGTASFYVEGDKAKCDDENMNRTFIEAMLVAYAKTLTLTHK